MQAFMTSLYNLVLSWQGLIVMLVVIVLIGLGALMVLPGEGREKAKKSVPWVVIGCGVVLGATFLAKEIASAFVF